MSSLKHKDVRRYLVSKGWTEVGPSSSPVDAAAGIRQWSSPTPGISMDFCGEPECDLQGIAEYEHRSMDAVETDMLKLRFQHLQNETVEPKSNVITVPCPEPADVEIETLRRERDAALERCKLLRELADRDAHDAGNYARRMIEAQTARDEARRESKRLLDGIKTALETLQDDGDAWYHVHAMRTALIELLEETEDSEE